MFSIEKRIKNLTLILKRKEGIQFNSVLRLDLWLIVFFLVTEDLLPNIKMLQEIIMSLTLQLREKDKQIEKLKQSLKGNCNYEVMIISFVDVRLMPKAFTASTNQIIFCEYFCRVSASIRIKGWVNELSWWSKCWIIITSM